MPPRKVTSNLKSSQAAHEDDASREFRLRHTRASLRTNQICVSRKDLLQRIHEAGDNAIQIFIRATLRFNFIDGVKYGRVVLAAKLPPNLRQRRGGELLDDVHSHLPRKGNSACVAAYLQILLPKIEMFADALLVRSNNIAQHLLCGGQ